MSSRLEVLENNFKKNGGCFKEVKVGKYFTKINTPRKKDFNKASDTRPIQSKEFSLPLVTATHGDNGIMYYGRAEDWVTESMTLSVIQNGAIATGDVYPQPQETGVIWDGYLIKPSFDTSERILIYLASALEKTIKLKFSYDNKAIWQKVKQEYISLPINSHSNEINIDFMEDYIREIEENYIREIDRFLLSSGLINCSLPEINLATNFEATKEEILAIESLKTKEFKKFKVTDIFNIKNTSNPLSRDIKENSGLVPYLCASAENNGVSSYISYDDSSFLNKGNCVFIGGKTFVVSYQEKDFFSNDSHNLALYLKEKKYSNQNIFLGLATCINLSLGHKYSWGNSISSQKIKHDFVTLPLENGQPDFEFLGHLASALKKLVLKSFNNFMTAKKSELKIQ